MVRLSAGDSLEFIVQDDLSDATFTKFACVVQGTCGTGLGGGKMDEGLKTILLWLFGGFTVVDIIRLLVAKGRQCRVIEEHDERLDALENKQASSDKELSMLKESTSIRLATIEVK